MISYLFVYIVVVVIIIAVSYFQNQSLLDRVHSSEKYVPYSQNPLQRPPSRRLAGIIS
jgi:hypothetical protein